jgi:hypothetical protein
MRRVSDLKGAGYLTSTASVALLGAVSWKSAMASPWLTVCLVLGLLLSITGMMLRWRSHRLDQKEKEQIEMGQETRPSQTVPTNTLPEHDRPSSVISP